ncbi:dihydrolipoyl dehydrogenase [Alkalibaculum sp. M08DMB]|uniref:Dihydrolipoyl dehydrogenase n=1 Tax=Alkalibaculum sporogenes TaxID=2655001 RepID=A0A6A7KB00_9FIRM|nr:dihydrolipoyl dehydrogenase [Alkalibaculum sporogenes]MPW26542.1 dihydrolipoyl dehydrogenase [Alkalibaculum sporogenes]
MTKKVVVIGGGPGGYAAALYSAHLGMSVTLIEKKDLGGTCLNVGCVPTKAFVQSSNSYNSIKKLSKYGINIDGNVSVDFKKTAKFKSDIVKQLRNGVTYLLKAAKVKVIYGNAKIVDENTVEIISNEETVREQADYIIISTGSRVIDIPKLESDGKVILNSTQILDIQELPESIAIIGGGVIGVEFASIMKNFGKDVTIIELSSNIIPTEDIQISETLKHSLEKRGIRIYTETEVKSIVSKTDNSVTFIIKNSDGEKELTTEKMLISIGRKANLEGIGLEQVGIEFNEKYIITNEKMQTNVSNIFAVGDVTKSPQLAHVAYYEAQVAALNISGKDTKIQYNAIPSCIFSHPEVSRVGMTEEQARKEINNVGIEVQSFSSNGKAMIELETEGFVKMIYNIDNKEVLGFSIIGPKATELIAEPSLAINLRLNIEELSRNINAHPSLSEMIGETASASVGLNLHSL